MGNPEGMREAMAAMRNPALMQEMQRNNDRAMANVEANPQAFNALRRMYQELLLLLLLLLLLPLLLVVGEPTPLQLSLQPLLLLLVVVVPLLLLLLPPRTSSAPDTRTSWPNSTQWASLTQIVIFAHSLQLEATCRQLSNCFSEELFDSDFE